MFDTNEEDKYPTLWLPQIFEKTTASALDSPIARQSKLHERRKESMDSSYLKTVNYFLEA